MTSINTLGYADVPPAMLSRATASPAWRSNSRKPLGSRPLPCCCTQPDLRGGTALAAPDFYPVFMAVAMISLLSVPFFLKMAPDAGAEVSGRAAAQ